MKKAVLYLRSSKDQKDVSIQTQRAELTLVAQRRGIELVGEYSDVVESAKDWDRPGFMDLVRDVRKPARGWDTVIALDTARIARRRNLALVFEEHECAAHGVTVVYANLPEGGHAPTQMLLRSMLQAMDEWHSLVSREKGLAGMAQNVRQGFRAGGTAPFGYQLKAVPIGIVRNGLPVTKSRLEATADADLVQQYLQLRLTGTPRLQAARAVQLPLGESSLLGLEWNALTYAGCTTFGVYHERTNSGGYKGRRKRRPRSEWQVQENTHRALISVDQAERLIHALEHSDHAKATSAGRRGTSPWLLTSLLATPRGEPWEVSRKTHYCAPRAVGGKRYIPMGAVDEPVLGSILEELQSDRVARALVDAGRGQGPGHASEIKALHKRVAELAVMIDKAAELSLSIEDPAPYQRKIEQLERERRQAIQRQAELKEIDTSAEAMSAIGVDEMKQVLADFAASIKEAPPDRIKLALRQCVSSVVLDADTLDCTIHYAVAAQKPEINPVSLALLRQRPSSRILGATSTLRLEYVDGRQTRWKRAAARKGMGVGNIGQ